MHWHRIDRAHPLRSCRPSFASSRLRQRRAGGSGVRRRRRITAMQRRPRSFECSSATLINGMNGGRHKKGGPFPQLHACHVALFHIETGHARFPANRCSIADGALVISISTGPVFGTMERTKRGRSIVRGFGAGMPQTSATVRPGYGKLPTAARALMLHPFQSRRSANRGRAAGDVDRRHTPASRTASPPPQPDCQARGPRRPYARIGG